MSEKNKQNKHFSLYRISATFFIVLSIPFISKGDASFFGYASLIIGIFLFTLSKASVNDFMLSRKPSNNDKSTEDNRKDS